MVDIVSTKKRSQMMAGIKSKNTVQEILVRRMLHKQGFRFRLHDKNLPGKPDLVLKKYKAVIFVHGCFWHGHDCHLFKLPKTRTEFWQQKISGNKERDIRAKEELKVAGWRILEIWECALKGKRMLSVNTLTQSVVGWLLSDSTSAEIRGLS